MTVLSSSTPSAARRSRVAFVGAAALAVGAFIGLAPLASAPAQAHNYLVSSNPTAGSTVTEQPGTIVITTNDALLDLGGESGSNQLQVKGPGDAETFYGDGCTTVNGPALTMPAQLGQPGDYTVIWQVVSTDGHPISDEFTFTWAPDASQALAEGSPTAPVCGQAADPGASAGASDAATDAATAAPAPQPSASAVPSSEPQMTTQDASGEQSQAAGDILWIAAAVVVILAAGIVVVLVLRRRNPAAADGAGGRSGDDPADPADSSTDDPRGGPTAP